MVPLDVDVIAVDDSIDDDNDVADDDADDCNNEFVALTLPEPMDDAVVDAVENFDGIDVDDELISDENAAPLLMLLLRVLVGPVKFICAENDVVADENIDGDDDDVGVVGFENDKFFWCPLTLLSLLFACNASLDVDLYKCKSLLQCNCVFPLLLLLSFVRMYFGETDEARPPCTLDDDDDDAVDAFTLLTIDEYDDKRSFDRK